MTAAPKNPRVVKRILVPMDVSTEARAGLAFAARLARALESRLEALFIEDQDLMSLAGLPFTRELSLTSGLPQALDMDRLERDFRAKAAAAERLLAQIAHAENVPSSFRTARGKTEVEISAATQEGDLVTVGRALGAVVGRGAQGGAVRIASRRVVGSILLAGHRPAAMPRNVDVVFAGTDTCETALKLGERLAQALKARLNIHLPAMTAEARQTLEDRVRRALVEPASARFHAAGETENLLSELCCRPDSLVVAATAVLDHSHESIERLAAGIACPLLLVQSGAPETAEGETPAPGPGPAP